MNTKQQNPMSVIAAVGSWLFGGLGRLVQFLDGRPAGYAAEPVRVRASVKPEARASRNRLNPGHFRKH